MTSQRSLPIYRPVRDNRFEYATDAIAHIEENLCYTCKNKGDDEEFPSIGCDFEPINLVFEIEVPTVIDVGTRLLCTKYERQS